MPNASLEVNNKHNQETSIIQSAPFVVVHLYSIRSKGIIEIQSHSLVKLTELVMDFGITLKALKLFIPDSKYTSENLEL